MAERNNGNALLNRDGATAKAEIVINDEIFYVPYNTPDFEQQAMLSENI